MMDQNNWVAFMFVYKFLSGRPWVESFEDTGPLSVCWFCLRLLMGMEGGVVTGVDVLIWRVAIWQRYC